MTTSTYGEHPDAPRVTYEQDATLLLLEHCARSAHGRSADAAVVAAVVGVERVSLLLGSCDTQTLRAAVTDGLAAPLDTDLGALLVQLRQSIALALSRP
ncbi:MAG: hypothetical protein EOO67_16535, partial [Microbacterium sp.]